VEAPTGASFPSGSKSVSRFLCPQKPSYQESNRPAKKFPVRVHSAPEEEYRVKTAHLSLETLARWLAGDLPYEDLMDQVLAHFMACCPTCRRRYEEILRLQQEIEHWDERVAVFEGLQAPELVARLAGLPFDEQLALVADDESLHTWGVCQLLLQKSREAAFEDPARAVNFAELGLKVALNLDDAYDPHWVLDLRAKACAHVGNARRVFGELRSADTAFRDAHEYLDRSMTGNDRARAEVLNLESSLRREQRRFGEALGLLDESINLYEELDDRPRQGRSLINKAKVLEEMGRLEAAIDLLPHALELLDSEQDQTLMIYGRYNQIGCLLTAERFQEAESLLPEVRSLFERIAKPVDLIRLRWAGARIAAGRSDDATAEQTFRAVQEEFFRLGLPYDAAYVALDLAALYSRQKRHRDLKELALEILPVFEARDVHREALAALLLFRQAVEEERLTVEVVHQLAETLRRSRPNRM
jgi:tetratricopeptide (TPR) repeat protein